MTSENWLHAQVLRKRRPDLTDGDTETMQRVVDFAEDRLENRPGPGAPGEHWRHSPMTVGHDPLKPWQRAWAGMARRPAEGANVRKFSIEAMARQQLEAARQSAAARSATTVVGGHEQALRHTILALVAGARLAEHDNPGEATLYVLSGRVTLAAGGESWPARTGDMLVIPGARHTVHAEEDSTLLLTAIPRNRTA